jgi:hypothetical protein
MTVTFKKSPPLAYFTIEVVSCYQDEVFVGNIVRPGPDSAWHTSKNLADPVIYFETLDDAEKFVTTRFE